MKEEQTTQKYLVRECISKYMQSSFRGTFPDTTLNKLIDEIDAIYLAKDKINKEIAE